MLVKFLDGSSRDVSDLRRANLEGADLRRAYLEGADLRGAYLRGANLGLANLEGAYLRGANLGLANLKGAYLYGANLYGANLKGAYLEGADLRRANLYGAYVVNTRGLVVLPCSDPRGYMLIAVQYPRKGWRFFSGCRGPLTYKEALKHWGRRHHNQPIASRYRVGLMWFKKNYLD